MALNIDLDGFGFLSDSDVSKLSPTLKQQPPISPIESESSSGISSLDSDDLKKQLLSSPTISHDDDDQQSDGSVTAVTKDDDEEDDEKDSERSTTDEEEEEEDERASEDDDIKNEVRVETTDEKKEIEQQEEMVAKRDEPKQVVVVYEKPPQVVYQNRDILDLGRNLRGFGPLVQFTVLPENNVNCFFQNRAQYWRLSSGERQEYSLEKCSCCDFTYPSTQQPLNQGPKPIAKNANAVTESLMAFLKSTEPVQPISPIKRSVNYPQYGGYPMQQQQQQQSPPQQYQSNNNNGFYNNNNQNSSFTGNYANQQMNSFMNNNTGYGTTLALLNLMNNASRNAASAFQAMSSTNTNRFYNNMNNGYKQF